MNKSVNFDINVPFTIQESVTSIGHKRKASQEIDPSGEYANDYATMSRENKRCYVMNDEKKIRHGRLQLDLNKRATENSLEHETRVEPYCGENFVESHDTMNISEVERERAKKVKGMPHGGFMLDLNKEAEEIVNSQEAAEEVNPSTSNNLKTSLPVKIVFDFDLNEPLPEEDA